MRLAIGLVVLALIGGCAPVQPWQRGELSRATMTWEPDPMRAGLGKHVYGAKEASTGGAGLGGGGCGCN